MKNLETNLLRDHSPPCNWLMQQFLCNNLDSICVHITKHVNEKQPRYATNNFFICLTDNLLQ